MGTVDGAELECGDQHLWKFGDPREENGIYDARASGFAGTYTPLPEDK